MPKKERKPPKQPFGKTMMKDLKKSRANRTEVFADSSLEFDLGTKSVTEQTSLNDFILKANMENRDFTATKRENIQLVDASSLNTVLTQTQNIQLKQKHEDNKHLLSIPRRPVWNPEMTKEELEKQENESFLEWRRNILDLKNKGDFVLTPYEINLNFWRQLWRVVERGDILVQIVDARNPLQFRCEDLEKYVLEVDPKKINMILMNKSDLLTAEQRKTWANYFKSISLPVIFFSALTESEAETCEMDLPLPSAFDGSLYNREQLIQYFETLPLEKTERTVAMVGYPNVGKSSTINALMQCKSVSVSSRPGKTKHFQTHLLTDTFTLCDCPGLVFPSFAISKADMVLNGILPIDNLNDYKAPMAILASMIPRHILKQKYKIYIPINYVDPDSIFTSGDGLLNSFAFERKLTTGHGNPDCAKAARIMLKDFTDGRLVFCTAPPGIDQDSYHIYEPELIEETKNLTRPHQHMLKTCGLADKEEEFRKAEMMRRLEDLKVVSTDTKEPQTLEERLKAKTWRKKSLKKGPKIKLRVKYRHLDE